MTHHIEIIGVGNELLIGKIANTNAQWLAKRITTTGLAVSRMAVIGDEIAEISKEILEALKRKPQMIITTGGLGPTFDDKTLEGIGKALKRPLKVNPEAMKMIEAKYHQYLQEGRIEEKVELTPPRVKMATLPESGKPLHNPLGTAPGVLIKVDDTSIIALPGVPPEMEAIFDESIQPILKKMAGNAVFYETSLAVDGIMESDLAPLIDKTMNDNPYIYIKSHPGQRGEGKPHLELHLSTTAQDSGTAKKRVTKALLQITGLVEEAKHGKIKFKKPK
ncbi:MAG TPA: molybdopterin-binding protein [Candidatus Bathyarchaeia archaeon]|nr:molybdopterin-binding protein [Candidatus Bathyarchaeia archaeon]